MSNKEYWNPENPWGHELIVNRLLEEGVEYIFALTGGHILAVLNAAHEKGINVVSSRTEDGAVLAATGYALATGKVGVAAFGAGMIPMAINGACNAAMGQVPVVIISGAERSDADDRKMVQGSDVLPFARASYCKSAYHVTKWARIPDMISRAFQDATTGTPGCTFIDIPKDIMVSRGDPAEFETYPFTRTSARSAGDPEDIARAVELLADARRPAVLVDRQAHAADVGDEIKRFVELTGIPVEKDFGTLGESPCNLGAVGLFPMAADADVVLVLGRVAQSLKGSATALPYTGKLIYVYTEPEDIGRCNDVEVAVAGNTKLVLQQLISGLEELDLPDHSGWVRELIGRREKAAEQFRGMGEQFRTHAPVHPAFIAGESVQWMVDHNLHKEANRVEDGGDSLIWWWNALSNSGIPQQRPAQAISIGSLAYSFGAVGSGPALAVGMVCARPGEFLLMPSMGDGSIGYHMAELETIGRLGAHGVMIMYNNSCWAMVYSNQRNIWGREATPGSFFAPGVRYDRMAEGLGWAKGEHVAEPGELRPALDRAYERAMEERKMVMVNVETEANAFLLGMTMKMPQTEAGEDYLPGT
ncbi:MAG: thiamine pyrophosphate-binding protein [Rhodospirillaceae bacterium]|nr:thiamine pyrophosphate-binding protein [Rhodospirillaceae bacterium]